MYNKIYNIFKNNPNKSYKIKHLLEILNLSGSNYNKVKGAVYKLIRDKKIVKDNKKFSLNEDNSLIKGKLQMHKRGFGFVIPFDENIDDIYIPPMKLNQALDGDKVEVKEEYYRGKREGKIVNIIERAYEYIVGTYVNGLLEPIEENLPKEIKLKGRLNEEYEEKVVKAKIISYDPLRCKVSQILGEYDDPEIDDEIIINKFNLKKNFPEISDNYYERLEKRYDRELKNRKDYTDKLTFTIDPSDAKDNDDAVSLEKTDNGWTLYVHIADVSFFVEEGSPLDDIAYQRGYSAYLIDKFLPMLPLKVTRDFCSLRKGPEKLAITVKMDLDYQGELVSKKIDLSKVKIDKVFSYRQVYEIINNNNDEYPLEWKQNLIEMKNVAKKLNINRLQKGAVDFEREELKIELDENKNVKDVYPKKRNWSHKLIEEFMIKANETVSSFLEKTDRESIFRIHEKPSNKKLKEFKKLLEVFNIKTKNISIDQIRKVLKKISDTPYESYLKVQLLKSMKQARYSYYNIGHYGLQSESYTHFTSPIRRYPDLLIHRIIKGRKFKKDYLRRTTKYLSEVERNTERAERESYNIKILRYINNQPDDKEYEGLILNDDVDKLAIELINYQVGGIAYNRNVNLNRDEIYPGEIVKVKVIFVDPIYKILELKV
ncbi:MAG: VacB/RNase II family 3'-5' exoribonuclease [Candidatus Mcinerneyibacterium aminivorans]|uniref:exoribonuclease II n=1 Tax=Candidatus Mcinerneyibacterium aminivorans TaxID=2703815 RepID=A0A5D0MEN4_9BACT|nr:MAG: VacB/RNase II family 3'-5' exoribonuclease [Candidatus Mcinerneyibacterium aminivorans]